MVRSNREHRTKSGKGRVVPMTPRLRQALMEHRMAFAGQEYGGETSEWVFHHATNRRHAKAGERIGTLYRGFMAAVERAKLDKDRITQHDLRHTRCTRWLADGRPPQAVQHAMGHADLKTTMGYYDFTDEHLRTLVDQVPNEQMAALGG